MALAVLHQEVGMRGPAQNFPYHHSSCQVISTHITEERCLGKPTWDYANGTMLYKDYWSLATGLIIADD